MDLSGYALAILHQDAEFVLARGIAIASPTPHPTSVLVSMLTSERPDPERIRMLEHELAMRAELDSTWAVRPLALGQHQGRAALILEDQPGEPLEGLLDQPPVSPAPGAPRSAEPAMELGLFLRLAAGLAAALGEAHRRGIIHKDVKPAHVLVNTATGQVWLTGFGISSQLARERQTPDPPETIAGTLAYMAPEQTGRMNRSIDGRSDIYSLGVTLYRMLTGSLPFSAAEPIEWVHCHIARQPMAPGERVANVPAPVSAIIMKLLAKTAEERYQTAACLEGDLRRCLAQWEAERRIGDFPLGEHDTPDRLVIPEKLYGRASEVETLLTAFDRVVQGGRPELVLVSGYSGIGKSSVVNELHKVLLPPRALFAAGKCDQYKRDIPYSTLAQSFRSLIISLLATSEVELADWREALREALGPNGPLMVDLVPELRLIIGEQAPVPELPPRDAQRRFQLVLRRFFAVFARADHPLALFLDDLQWLDSATFDLLEDLMTHPDVRHVLLIGAYRDNEVTAGHPLMGSFDRIRSAGAPVHEIVLAPLTREWVRHLVADSLYSDQDAVAPLAELVHQKTRGNPFFVIQFLSALVEEGLISFDHGAARWSWDLARIHAKAYTDNVVGLMVRKLGRLPIQTQTALRRLACLGNIASTATLSLVQGTSEERVHDDLWEAVRHELIDGLDGSYKFVHDRIHEAAYSLIPEESRPAEHLRVGRLLLQHTPPETREETIFAIVNQLNRGASLIASREEREQLAGLNLIAGRRAKASTAYAAALNYLVVGGELLADEGWRRCHELTFALELNRAECEFLTGDLGAAEKRLAELATFAAGAIEEAPVACLRIDLYMALDRSRAIEVGLDYLRRRGIDWSLHPTDEEARQEYERIWSQLGSRTIEQLIDLPWMTQDADSLATLGVLTRVGTPALFTDKNLNCLVICRAINLGLEHGHSDGSCAAYAWLAMLAGYHFGDYRAGFRFGQLGHDLADQRGLKRFQAVTYNIFGGVVLPTTKHLRAGLGTVRRAFAVANEIGDLSWAAYSACTLTGNLLIAGDPLADVQREAESGLQFAKNARFGFVVDQATVDLGLIRTLRGLTRAFGRFDDAQLDEGQFERHLSTTRSQFAECWWWIRKLQARFLAGDHAEAVDAAAKVQKPVLANLTVLAKSDHGFFAALSHAAACDLASAGERGDHLEAIAGGHRQLEMLAENCPENFAHRAALVGAEIARLQGRPLEAMDLYERAIDSAKANAFVNDEAVANELAARFYAGRGLHTIAHAYLRNARYGYLRWGADGKVRQLDAVYPHLKMDEAAAGPTGTIAAPLEQLDLTTVIKVSQAVSAEVVLEKLLDTMMRAAIEHAGAERALLILLGEAGHRLAAEATSSNETVTVRLSDEPVNGSMLPETVLRYVLHARESVALDDAATVNAFSGDSYIAQRHARSVLCVPLTNQGKLIGVLYFENNLAPRVFAPARTAVLKLLASQAAISIENSRLYRDLAERESRIRRMIDAAIIGIFSWHADGRVLDANGEFVRIIGHSREDLVSGRVRWTDFTLPEWRERDAHEMVVLRAGGPSQPQERELLRKDGARVPVMTGGTMFEGSKDEGVAFVFDLTESRRVEQALRESEHESRLIVNTIPGLVAALTPAGEVDVVNDQLVEYCGQGLEAMRQWGTNGTIHPGDLPRVAEVFTRGIAAGEAYEVEGRVRRFDGVYRWFQIRGLPLRDTQGQIVRWYSLLSDVDDRKRAEVELRRAYDSFVDAQRLSKTGSFIADIVADDNVFSAEASRIFEFDPATKITVQRVREVIHPDDLPGWDAMIARAMTGVDVDFAYRIVTTRGAVKHVRGIAHVREQIAGRPLFVGALQDVTESVVKEDALTRARSELAHVSRLTTMGELTASIAHEVKQPIAAAVTSAQTALRWLEAQPPELGEVREALARTVRAGKRAGDVVGQIRALVTKAPPRKDSVEINAAIREVVELTRGEAEKNRVSVRTVLAEGLPLIQGDRVQLQQVILNLIINGIEAMADGGEVSRDLLISSRKGDSEGVLVAVADTGPGLAAGALEQVFAAFHTTKPDGLGLGLSICRSIIEAHDGRLWASANERRGAVFQFTLPVPAG